MHFFGARTRQAVIKTIAVVYELMKRTQEMLFADWVQQYKAFFVPIQEPAFAWPFENSLMRVSTQGLFHPCLKAFVAPFLPAWLTAPVSLRMHLPWLCSGLLQIDLLKGSLTENFFKHNYCHACHTRFWRLLSFTILAPVVQTLDSAIYRIIHYPADNY